MIFGPFIHELLLGAADMKKSVAYHHQKVTIEKSGTPIFLNQYPSFQFLNPSQKEFSKVTRKSFW
jgi:hypothetical protein